jgi:branched-chain amino acid transport system substrate-binding protein
VPTGTTDFSIPLAQARASGAKIVGLAMSGTDLRRCLGTAAELGIVNGGQRLASMSAGIGDVLAVGQDFCQGLVLANSFYWDFYLPMRSWTDLHIEKLGSPPDEYSTGLFAAVRHWLSAANAAGTLEADAVAARMRMTPVLYSRDEVVMIQPNGCVPHAMHLWQVKPPADSRYRWDVFERLATLPSPDAYPAPDATGCPMVKA